jgi:hypothetical protein
MSFRSKVKFAYLSRPRAHAVSPNLIRECNLALELPLRVHFDELKFDKGENLKKYFLLD